jgi:hypothetical protein
MSGSGSFRDPTTGVILTPVHIEHTGRNGPETSTVRRPGKSLGVISMGIKHAMRIQGALDQAQAKHPELAEFFDPGRTDRFFVKNLERVQGDERDCIILTVGYGKDRAGNLPASLRSHPCGRRHAPSECRGHTRA